MWWTVGKSNGTSGTTKPVIPKIPTNSGSTPTPVLRQGRVCARGGGYKAQQNTVAETTPAVALTRALLSQKGEGGGGGWKCYDQHSWTCAVSSLHNSWDIPVTHRGRQPSCGIHATQDNALTLTHDPTKIMEHDNAEFLWISHASQTCTFLPYSNETMSCAPLQPSLQRHAHAPPYADPHCGRAGPPYAEYPFSSPCLTAFDRLDRLLT